MLDFVSIPECGGGPSPLPAPKEMKNIPTVTSIMAEALERLIRREGGGKSPGYLEASVIDDGLRSMWPANHHSIRQKRNRPKRAQVKRRSCQGRTDSFKLVSNVGACRECTSDRRTNKRNIFTCTHRAACPLLSCVMEFTDCLHFLMLSAASTSFSAPVTVSQQRSKHLSSHACP